MSKLFDRKQVSKDCDKLALIFKAAAKACQVGVSSCEVLSKMYSNKNTKEALITAVENICTVFEDEIMKVSVVAQSELGNELMRVVSDIEAFKEADRDAARGPQPKKKRAQPQYNEEETEHVKAPSEDEVKGMFSNIFKFKKRDEE